MSWPREQPAPEHHCDRCHATGVGLSMSYFNTDMLCTPCEEKERAHPQFAAAKKEEIRQCKKGNYNFPGVGKPADL